ncbi:hypothetical protein Ahu01nite_060890 [Winogradskya humida]|uniref:DUF1996 domain-containing protein n=1 Tax=Winogradskya humida TaxID=113566 RepID=A0ABQ3ZXT1_9ACTN|nr:hypothetical protein Ahu01nite_060890 [Actinoplanes humidus]
MAAVAATGALTAVFVSGGGKGSADASTERDQFVRIEKVQPNVVNPRPGRRASTGTFTVDCGTNGNGKFSPDNPVAQPGITNGAEHVHDFVGNLAITAKSSDADLAASGTTCTNGDRSSYFWPVVRIDRTVRSRAETQQALASTTPAVTCPDVRDRLPAVPVRARPAVDSRLAQIDRAYADANTRMATGKGRVDADFNESVLTVLRTQRAQLIRGISDSIAAAGGGRTTGLLSLVECDTNYDGMHASMRHTAADVKAKQVATQQVRCPAVRDRLPGVPSQALDEVNRGLAELDRQISDANESLVVTRGNAVLGPLNARRTAVLDRISTAIGRNAARPQGLEKLAPCTVTGQPTASAGSTSALPDPQGPNLELPNNTGGIVRPASVLIQYRGNAARKVVPMPRFLRELTGDAKPTSRGPANARATWTCSGFTDRLSDKYPICPRGQQVQRVQDFPGCWDGTNIDSTNHRDHVAFADTTTGACKKGFVAIPQLRITLSYKIPQDVQVAGQYALDSFPEEDHNPFSDHNDFINVNGTRQMQRIAACINKNKTCR